MPATSIIFLVFFFFCWTTLSNSFKQRHDYDITDVTLDNSQESNKLLSARCFVRCLSTLQNFSTSGTSAFLSSCSNNVYCSQCTIPCNDSFVNYAICREICKIKNAGEKCEESCTYMNDVVMREQEQERRIKDEDVCRVLAYDVSSASFCTRLCDTNKDCPDPNTRCCSNGCGTICQAISNTSKNVLRTPEILAVRPKVRSGTVKLRWTRVDDANTGLVLYVVEQRSSDDPNDINEAAWKTLEQTTSTLTALRNIIPERWYQFRVASVTQSSTSKYSSPTEPLSMAEDLLKKPEAPTDLKEFGMTTADGVISTNIQWSLEDLDQETPLDHFKVYWRKTTFAASDDELPSEEITEIIPPDKRSALLQDLQPNSVYAISVQAFYKVGSRKMKSSRANMYIGTASKPASAEQVAELSTRNPAPMSFHVAPPPVTSLASSDVYFQNGLLKANISWTIRDDRNSSIDRFLVSWSPEVCESINSVGNDMAQTMSTIIQENYFIIYDLRFECRYVIRVQTISIHGVTGSVSHLTLKTPHCNIVNVVGDVKPDCPLTVLKVPEAPADLRYSFIISNSNITTRLTWAVPISDAPVTDYLVSWGQTNKDQMSTETSELTKKLISKEIRTLSISSLSEGVTYSVTVQAISKAGIGNTASIQLTTPKLQEALHPADRDLDRTGNRKVVNYATKNVKIELHDEDEEVLQKYNILTTTPTITTAATEPNPSVDQMIWYRGTNPRPLPSRASYFTTCTILSLLTVILISLNTRNIIHNVLL